MFKFFLLIIFFCLCLMPIDTVLAGNTNKQQSQTISTSSEQKDRMLLVLAAPSIHDEYYQEYFDQIVEFQINYAKMVLANQIDDVRILVDEDTIKYFRAKLPKEILIEEGMYDIWMRDFSTVNPENPVQFSYTDASMGEQESKRAQQYFSAFANQYDVRRKKTQYKIDGGNIVDNYSGDVITTTRFLEDNDLEFDEAKDELKKLLNAQRVAIIPPDEDVLAHSDGMVAWLDDDVLAVNDYSDMDEEFHNAVMSELEKSFPDVKIIAVPVRFDEGKGADDTKGIGSACGVNLNLVATYNALYVPVFGDPIKKEVLKIIRDNTSKEVIEVNANHICKFGGSVRCTTWQLSSPHSKGLLTSIK